MRWVRSKIRAWIASSRSRRDHREEACDSWEEALLLLAVLVVAAEREESQ